MLNNLGQQWEFPSQKKIAKDSSEINVYKWSPSSKFSACNLCDVFETKSVGEKETILIHLALLARILFMKQMSFSQLP